MRLISKPKGAIVRSSQQKPAPSSARKRDGTVIEIDHGDGVVTLYGHNEVLYVKKGDTVTRGQEISKMGNTGRVYGATGIHVHFEVRVNGVKKNPLLYLDM